MVPAARKCFWEETDESGDYRALLLQVRDVPYICADLCRGGSGCGDRAFWALVRAGWDAVPTLVEALDDATRTGVGIPNGTGEDYARADIALEALVAIVDIPYAELLAIEPSKECGSCSWIHFVRSPGARTLVKAKVSSWIDAVGDSRKRKPISARAIVDCVEGCEPAPISSYYTVAREAARKDYRGLFYDARYAPCVRTLDALADAAPQGMFLPSRAKAVDVATVTSGLNSDGVEFIDVNRAPTAERFTTDQLRRQLRMRSGRGYAALLHLGFTYERSRLEPLRFEERAHVTQLRLDNYTVDWRMEGERCRIESLTYDRVEAE